MSLNGNNPIIQHPLHDPWRDLRDLPLLSSVSKLAGGGVRGWVAIYLDVASIAPPVGGPATARTL